jgi:hypothetical protein
VDLHNPATDLPRLGVPSHVVADLECVRHDSSPGRMLGRAEILCSATPIVLPLGPLLHGAATTDSNRGLHPLDRI